MQVFSPLEDQIRECFGRVVYTHKTHEKMADGCKTVLNQHKFWQVLLSAISATSAIGALIADQFWLKLLNTAVACATAWNSGMMKSFDPGGSAQKHRDAASALWSIRESYLSLLTDLRSGAIDDLNARQVRDRLQERLSAIYKGAPQTNGEAYGEAQKALKDNEEYTFSDAEIDAFLPKSLRKRTHDDN